GGLNAIGELSKTYGKHIRVSPDDLPAIELNRGSYQHPNRTYGEIRYPIFRPVGWVPKESIIKLIGDGSGQGDIDGGSGAQLEMLKPPASSVTTGKKPAAAAAKAAVSTKKST